MTEPNILTIKRSQWRRGKGSKDTFLLDSAGHMCCLGFDALACGLSPEMIRGVKTPLAVAKRQPELILYRQSRAQLPNEAVQAAIEHNDDPELSEPTRESRIREDLMQLGWDDVRFVD